MTVEQALHLRQGRKLVFTNGVYDILHTGHLTLLERAATLGDVLIVGINSDASVRRLGKGPERPINHEVERLRLIEALRCVDGAVLFEEDDPRKLIQTLRPEVHVKGGDYDPETMPETPVVRSYGGTIHIMPLVPDRSTTRLVEAIRKGSEG